MGVTSLAFPGAPSSPARATAIAPAPARDAGSRPTGAAPPLGHRLVGLGLRAAGRASPALAGRLAGRLFLTPPRHERPAREHALLEFARPVLLRTERRERLAGWAFGDDAAPAVLLVHGWGGRGAQLGAYVSPLVARGRRVVAFDQLGHGDSDGRRNSLLGFARTIAQVVRLLGPVDGLVAHSLGAGASVLALAAGAPVGRAVLVASPSRPDQAVARFAAYFGLDEAAREEMGRDIARRIGAGWDSVDILGHAPRLTAPLRLYHDRDDVEVPWAEAAELAAAAPEATLVTTTGLGHRRILHDAGVVEEAVRFLTAERGERPRSPQTNQIG